MTNAYNTPKPTNMTNKCNTPKSQDVKNNNGTKKKNIILRFFEGLFDNLFWIGVLLSIISVIVTISVGLKTIDLYFETGTNGDIPFDMESYFFRHNFINYVMPLIFFIQIILGVICNFMHSILRTLLGIISVVVMFTVGGTLMGQIDLFEVNMKDDTREFLAVVVIIVCIIIFVACFKHLEGTKLLIISFFTFFANTLLMPLIMSIIEDPAAAWENIVLCIVCVVFCFIVAAAGGGLGEYVTIRIR